MTEFLQRVQKIGGSYMVRIPKQFADELDVQEGVMLFISAQKSRRSLRGVLPELKPWKREAGEFSRYD